MSAPKTPFTNLQPKSQDAIIQYWRASTALLQAQWNIREQLLDIDRAYMREQDWTKDQNRARIANKYGDPNKYQNVTVPVVMPQVEAAVTYQASVFLTGNPIFGVAASPQFVDAALQMETIIDNQSTRGAWAREFNLAFRDGFKYNLMAMEVDWTSEVSTAFETDLAYDTRGGKPVQILWEGNKIKRLDPYNITFDARYKPTDIAAHGEFAGYTEMHSRVGLIQMLQKLPFRMNYKAAFESATGIVGTQYPYSYYIPELNPDALLDRNAFATTDWMSWAGLASTNNNINYKNLYFVSTLYCRMIPSDFSISVPSASQPQIWKFIIVNGSVVVYAERQTNAHNLLPVMFGQPLEDGLGYQTKSFAQNVTPYQQVGSALVNSAIAARRRAISDRILYDPSRVDAKAINSDSPNARIPVRPNAYGKPLGEAVYAFPFRDDQTPIAFSDLAQVMRFSDMAAGQNPAQQGQFVKGNKTQFEYADIMGNASGRNQMTAMMLEAQLIGPIKEILKSNILQYQGGVSLLNRETDSQVQIDPVVLRKAQMEFKVSDGLTPTAKLLSTDAFTNAIQVIGSSPAISGAYNLGPMFSYLFKSQRADVAAFEKSQQQQAYEQALQAWQALAQLAIQNKQPFDQPQPVPQNYGYDPATAGKPQPKPTGSILEQVTAAFNSSTTPPQGAPANGPATTQPVPTV